VKVEGVPILSNASLPFMLFVAIAVSIATSSEAASPGRSSLGDPTTWISVGAIRESGTQWSTLTASSALAGMSGNMASLGS
jgi:hypothetical protein